MKAIIATGYGSPDVLKLVDIEKPVPKDSEVLVRVHASTVTSGEARMRGFRGVPLAFRLPARIAFGITKPRQPRCGGEFAGRVEAVGPSVTQFEPGDDVFGFAGMNGGANAEYVTLSADGLILSKPDRLTHNEAAAVPFGALSALFFVRDKGRVRTGDRLLVYGASGAVGVFAVQLGKYFGAHVTGVCSTNNVELIRSLGADEVVDYTTEDFTTRGGKYDVIFDTVGKTSFRRCRPMLNRNGRHLLAAFGVPQLFQMLWTSFFDDRKVVCAIAGDKRDDLLFIKGLIDAGRVRPVVGRRYPLAETAEAHRHVDDGHKVGAVVITVSPETT